MHRPRDRRQVPVDYHLMNNALRVDSSATGGEIHRLRHIREHSEMALGSTGKSRVMWLEVGVGERVGAKLQAGLESHPPREHRETL